MLPARRLSVDDFADEKAERLAFRLANPRFGIRFAQRDRARVVEVEGEIDILTARNVAAAVQDNDTFDIVILDKAKVPFMGRPGSPSSRRCTVACRRASAQ